MKKLLPKTNNNPKGFTLVELMVVITILAVLALIGLTAFTESQKRARDGKRIQEIDSIAKALEIHYKTTGTTGYQPLVASWFAGGVIPTDPLSTKQYCIESAATAFTASMAYWAGNCASGAVVSSSTPTAGDKFWRVCASSEVNGSDVWCKFSQQ